MARTATKREKPLATCIFLVSLVVLVAAAPSSGDAATSPAAAWQPTAPSSSAWSEPAAPAIAPSYPETRNRVSGKLEAARDQVSSELSRDLRQGYEQSSGWEAAGSLDAPGRGVKALPAGSIDDAIIANYQRYYNDAWQATVQRFNRGKIVIPEGMHWKTVLGRETDAIARARLRRFLAREGIPEGHGADVLVNRWLRDPSGSGAYRIPDVRLPNSRTILDGTIGSKTPTSPQIIDFRNFSGGDEVLIVRPQVGPMFGGG